MPSLTIGVSLKMYFGRAQTAQWCRAVADIAGCHPAVTGGHVRLVVLPSTPYLTETVNIFSSTRVQIGAQDLFWEDEGAYTGEVSGAQLRELGCDYAEIGHAERRRIFGEDDVTIAAKTAAAFRNRLTPLLCVGESKYSSVEAATAQCMWQLNSALSSVGDDVTAPMLVAYEPQWAIGATEPASAQHITAVCTALRAHLEGSRFTGSHVIYGGSAQPGLLTRIRGDIDGLFLGRFAHDPRAVSMILSEAVGGRPAWRSA
jgi:triosephosphate isomerase